MMPPNNFEGTYPQVRMRRLRYSPVLRSMTQEHTLGRADLVMPLFVRYGTNVNNPISSMPGMSQLSVDLLVEKCKALYDSGVVSVILFGIPETKDEHGHVGCSDQGIVQEAIRAIKRSVPNLYVIADVCNCEYTTHGHCGTIVRGDVDNDLTIKTLCKQSVSLAKAGVDMIAPSDMMDGRVGAIRRALDDNKFTYTPIMSYAVKYASSFYGPFRDAAESTPSFGDRATYQMNCANSDEALREVALDLKEGADIIMVKPALSYLDIIRRIHDTFPIPVAAYNVSGEFAMVHAAAQKGWIDEERMSHEILLSMKRAGAKIIISYHTEKIIKQLKSRW